MILQVHDELNFSVPEAEKEIIQKIVIEEMERAYRMLVPLKADFGWGKNWLEALNFGNPNNGSRKKFL